MNATQAKQMVAFQEFLDSQPFTLLVEEGALINRATISNAFQVHLLTKTRKPSVRTKKTPTLQCEAYCYSKGADLGSKMCGKAGKERDGVRCFCDTHWDLFGGNYKGQKDKTAETHPGYCHGCSKEAGYDVYHKDVRTYQILGTQNDAPICWAKTKEHSNYTGVTFQNLNRGESGTDTSTQVNQDSGYSELLGGRYSPVQSSTADVNVTSPKCFTAVNNDGTEVTIDLGEGEKAYWLEGSFEQVGSKIFESKGGNLIGEWVSGEDGAVVLNCEE